MDAPLIERAAGLLAALEAGLTADPSVDWSVRPPEGGADPAYVLGVALLPLCLAEPRLASLAEALTRPQPPARPARGQRAALLAQPRWEDPFVLVCGRLLALGPWPDRALQLADAPAGDTRTAAISPTLVRLVLARAEREDAAPEPLLERLASLDPGNPRIERLRTAVARAAHPLVFAEALRADPGLLDLYLERFGGDSEAALTIYAPGWTPEEVAARIGPIVAAAGRDAERARLTAIAVEATPENDAAAAGSATALIGGPADGPSRPSPASRRRPPGAGSRDRPPATTSPSARSSGTRLATCASGSSST